MQAGRENTAPDGPPGLLAWQVFFLAWVAGIWGLRHPEPALAAAGVLWAGLVLARRLRPLPALTSLALAALCFAGGQTHARLALPELPPADVLVPSEGPKPAVTARVAEVADRNFGRIELLLEDVQASGEDNATLRVPGRVALDWDEPGYRPAPGQTFAAPLRLRPVHGFANPGGADFEWQQRLRGVFFRAYARGEGLEAAWGPRPASLIWDARESLRASLLRLLPETQGGAVVLGLLLGERSRISPDTAEELRAAGLTHTLALSGLNVAYVAALGWALAWLAGLVWPRLYLVLPRAKLAVLLSAPLVAAYVWAGQASPSLLRAAWMFASWGLLLLLGRGRVLLDGLLLALAAMVLLDPLCVYDVGLQLSALAVAGLALLHPWLRGFCPRLPGLAGRGLFLVWDALSLTLAANLALVPLLVWYFGTFAPNILLNLPWVPVQGFAVQTLGMLGLALAPLPGLSGLAGLLVGWAAAIQDGMLDLLRQAYAAGLFPTWALLRPLWPELLGAGMALGLAPHCRSREGEPLVALLLAGLLLMAWPQARMLQEEARPELRLSALDVGQSQALLIELPGGGRVLVDGGGSLSPTFDVGRSVVGPALTWGRPPRLDAVLFSHPDADHAQGLAHILRHFRVGRFSTNGQWPGGRVGAALDAALAAGAPAPHPLRAGERLDLGGGVFLEAVHPPEGYQAKSVNDASLVLRLVWEGRPLALLPGDVQRPGIEEMIEKRRELKAEVLVLPHHGSKSSLSGLLYEAVAPAQALVSCGFQNQYRFPNRDVVAELALRGVPLASTAGGGMLRVAWTRGEAGFRLTQERR